MTQNEESMWERIFSYANMHRALHQVKANRGAAGEDGMTVGELSEHLHKHWPSIRAKLDARDYQPSPVKRVSIPKPDGGERLLGIPMVRAYCTSDK